MLDGIFPLKEKPSTVPIEPDGLNTNIKEDDLNSSEEKLREPPIVDPSGFRDVHDKSSDKCNFDMGVHVPIKNLRVDEKLPSKLGTINHFGLD